MSLPAVAISLGKQAVVRRVQAVFNDERRGQAPVARSPDSQFGPGSVIWRVHGDVTTMMVGGVAALLLQMLHPAVLAGVWDHSRFRQDMLGRLRRTARFIAVTTYGSREDAAAAVTRVRTVHGHVRGTLPDGTPYDANDPRLLAWVHVTEATCFLNAWIRYGEPRMSRPDQDRYFAEIGEVGHAMGVDPVPVTRFAAEQLIRSMRHELASDARTREVARLILQAPAPAGPPSRCSRSPSRPRSTCCRAGRAACMGCHGPSSLCHWCGRGTASLASTLRWAFR
jgi:uncharacterized protein (DUF2236 family)